MQRHLIILGKAIVVVFAIVGFFFTAVFVAMQFGLLNVRGSIADRNNFFLDTATSTVSVIPCEDTAVKVCAWNATPEWSVIKEGLTKDQAIIKRVSAETGVSERMIATVVVPEQTRFFTANREVFKRYFEPLKILGSLSQFSLGVSGIKEDTANKIEQYAADPSSPFYPGSDMNALFSYDATTTSHDEALYNRLTDSKNHYYSYLYTALFIKEIESQWDRSGFDIKENPEAVATLFNIGFAGSHPNAEPKAAGANISTGGQVYNYGTLGALFYRSSELTDIFSK